MDLSIIIVNFKNPKKTIRCINSIKKSNLDGIKYEIIVVDNASKDNSEEIIKEEYGNAIKYIQSKINTGMGEGNNIGIRESQGEYVLISNDDIIFKENAIFEMFNFIKKHKEVGIVGPKTLNKDKTNQQTYFRFPSFLMPFIRRTFLSKFLKKTLNNYIMEDFDGSYTKDVDWMMGSCLIARKELLDKIKGFDKRFWMYFEDIDLCRRIWENGFRVIYYPEAEIIHNHGKASAKGRWFLAPFTNKLARAHIISWLKYFWKWKFRKVSNRQ